jgi:1-aminocyclopropane-1-carboxylate deaminase
MDILTDKYLPHFVMPPVHSWKHANFEKAGISVDILRLDLIHPIIGGNKWMKLKGFIEQAIIPGKAGILTKGGPWSNHVHACAWLCNQLGIECYVWVKANSRIVSAMLKDVTNWHAAIKFINRTEFYDEATAIDFASNNNLLYIPMGGAEETGIRHVSQFVHQLNLPLYNTAICAVGTATTFGGFAFIPNNFKNLIGIAAGTGDNMVKHKIEQWQKALPDKTLNLIEDYSFGGFAHHTPELIFSMNELFSKQQIPTDIVYTAKLFCAVLDMADKHYFTEGSRLLVVHSGGLQGNRSLPAGLLQF